ncbi:hypothetical protein B0J13DRAFT_531642 [Dactylonectria estremocensis]|uniref:LysM domain-containing protein n=1 Tax=Dactylonectria estremocensis TaxID=1079267 RepID=A0A9P9IJ07_9HYPO|nr:hypothetical protein B0J13DRAFT_531642 [Dactylonectria estremocensis]
MSDWNQSCFTDPTIGENYNVVIAAFPNVTDLSDLVASDLCSYCNVKSFSMLQADAYSDVYEENWASSYEYVATQCNLTMDNINAAASAFNITARDGTTNSCMSGNTYTTKQGDSCDSIALSRGVSAATLYYINPNNFYCSDITAGTSLCLPLTSEILCTVRDNNPCVSIEVDSDMVTDELLSYNYSQVTWNCTNLQDPNPYWGTTLWVSTPGGNYTGQPPNTTTGGSQVVDPPSGVTVDNCTTFDCGRWYTKDGSLTCVEICIAYLIAINRFTAANPSLSKMACDADLVMGDAYCIDPLDGWDWVP